MPSGKQPTWAHSSRPRVRAASISPSSRNTRVGSPGSTNMAAIITGRPLAAAIDSSHGTVEVMPLVSMKTPRPTSPERAGQRGHLALVGQARRHRDAVLAVVLLEGGGGEADGAGAQRLHHDAAHLRDLRVGGGAPARLLAQHVGAHRGVAHEGRHVGHEAATLQRGEVLGIRLEVPVDPGPQRLERHALHVGQVAHDQVPVGGMARGDGEAAVADHHRGDAERARRGRVGIPGELGVVVRVEVHDPRREHEALRVDARGRGPQIGAAPIVADRGDAPVLHRETAVARGRAESIDEPGVVDHEIVHGWGLLGVWAA